MSAKKKNKKIVLKKISDKSIIKRNKPILIFLVKFFSIFIVLEALINLIDISIFTNLITSIIANFFNLPYINSIIFVNSTSFLVTNSCTGLVSLAILCAITLPLKRMEMKKRVLIVAIGALFLLILNIPRIGLVIYSGILGFDAELVHEFTWFFMSAVILLIWYYGIKWIQKEDDFSKLI